MHMVSSLSALCFFFGLALSYILPLCVLARVHSQTLLKHKQTKKKRRGSVAHWAQSYVFSLSLCKEKRRGRKIIGQRASERYTAVIARTRSETRVIRNPILTVCRAPTQPSLLPPTRFELLKNCLR